MSAAPVADSSAAPAPKGKSKLLLIAGVAVLLLGGAGGGAWFFLGQKRDEAHVEAPVAKRAAPTYLALENMVVNLADPGGERVAQIGITLELAGEKNVEQVKSVLPSIRSSLLVLISQRSSEELLRRDGKEKLAADVVAEVSQALGHESPKRSEKVAKAEAADGEHAASGTRSKARAGTLPVNDVLFSSFIIQ